MADVKAKKGGKPKKAAKAESEAQELMAKAVRRGDKLSRTLTQIVTQTKLDPSHPVHVLLKALDQNISKLRLHGEAQEQNSGCCKGGETETKPRRRPRLSQRHPIKPQRRRGLHVPGGARNRSQ